MISTRQSDIFWNIKALAIFTVCFAHFTPHYDGLQMIFQNIGMWGVPTFLIVAGYFDYTSKFSLKKNIKGLFAPLVIWGFITYCVIPFLSWITNHFLLSVDSSIPEFSIWGFFKWIVGSGTWLYFVSVLFECKLLCRIPYSTYFLPIIGLVSIILTQFDVIPYGDFFTKYMNPFNFIIYFLIGRLVRERFNDKDIDFAQYKLPILITALLGVVLISRWAKSYFCLAGLGTGILAFFILLSLSSMIKSKVLRRIGQHSFVIYFLHMQIGNIIFQNLPVLSGTPLEWINVVIAFVGVCLIIEFIYYILSKLKWNKVSSILGFR